MIVVLKQGASEQQRGDLIEWIKSLGLDVHLSIGKMQTVLGLIGDTATIDTELIEGLAIVESVMRVTEQFKKANRKFHSDDSIFEIGGAKIGDGNFMMIAGPCSVESEEQICAIAESVKASGAQMLRGGAYKPRTSPYDFQGMRDEGIGLLLKAKKLTGLPIVTEIMDLSHLEHFSEVDVIQVGARNMQNMELLKQLGRTKQPILLKRGLSSTLKELLLSAEYIMAGGNEQVILCERGIRTFETATRNTCDIGAVPVLKELSHLPVIVDPSHACGIARYVKPLTLAAVAAGADGIIVEVHNNPEKAMCDGPQSLKPEQFAELVKSVERVREAISS
ncbi:MAG: 3-deoxy-7-phosphoheptulonate synthase [Oscillospiraceae bacterium]|jgi:3-deoxy-7-phosphoheptulonate synthase|nr:3-deoxy-7-phosphoheptulonate synthase [Oscillospiraceae bacterium]